MSSTTTVLQETRNSSILTLPSGQTVDVKSETSLDVDEIPIIDVSAIWSDDVEAKKAIAEQVREASHRIGFFYAKHPGIDPKYARSAFEQGKRFCALPMERKLEVDTKLVPNGEAFNWAYDAAYDPEAVNKDEPSISIWPSDLPGFKDELYAFHTQMLQFARRTARIFALALHMPEDYFDEYVKHPEAGMRIIHYPQQEAAPGDQNGIGAHTDFECFTTLCLDEIPGLEILNKSGYWVKAKPVPDAFVVNIADCFMRQTNDFFVSTVHRVINKSARERYSLPFFFGFVKSVAVDQYRRLTITGSIGARNLTPSRPA
ncbi:hypothetical protein LTR15_000654 [Elasticomyces elasticus]|nr:hypothetical protein LTR15_000654 [Elasticomyces elasticus]